MVYFGAQYYPEHQNPAEWEHDLDRMREMHVNVLRVGEFAWCRWEPREGRYDFEWMDRFVDLAADREIQIVMAPPSRTIPPWLLEKIPEISILDNIALPYGYGARYTFCINHPVWRQKMLALAGEIAHHYHPHPNVVFFHPDNEYGDQPDCHCPVCRDKWHGWLGDRYESIDRLNAEWGTIFWGMEFDRFDQVPLPMRSKTPHNPALNLAWRRFRSDCTVEVVRMHCEAIRAQSDKPLTTNNQIWNPATDYYRMDAPLDVAGTNYYPAYGEENNRSSSFAMAMVRSYKRKGWFALELRNSPHMAPGWPDNTPAPGEVERLTMHCVANGADGIFYYLWRPAAFGIEQTHGALTNHAGRPRRVYHEAQRTGARLKRLASVIDATAIQSRVAVFNDFPTRWITEQDCAWVGPNRRLAVQRAEMIYRVTRELGYNCDAVGRDQDFESYRAILVGQLTPVGDALAEKLCRFVERGGALLWHPMCGVKNDEARIYPDEIHPKLRELFGADVSEYATDGQTKWRFFTWNGQTFAADQYFVLPRLLDGADEIATYTQPPADAPARPDCWFAGQPAVVERRVGRGRAVFVGAFAEARFYRSFLPSLLAQAGVEPILDTPVSPDIEVTERCSPDGKRLVFLINSTGRPQTLDLGEKPREDVWNEQRLSGIVDFDPWQVRVISR